MLKMDLVMGYLGILKKNLRSVKMLGGMVLGIDLVVGAGLVDGNAVDHMEVISVEDTAVLKVWLELILTVALVL